MHLNWFDYTIIAIIALSVLISVFRGFLRETISLITWVVGIVGAIRFMPDVAAWFKASIASPGLRSVLAFASIFLTVFIVGTIIGTIVKRCADATGFSIIDRLLGIIFGAARGVLLVAVLLIFLSMTQYQSTDMLMNSAIAPRFVPFNTWLKSFFPKQLDQLKQWLSQDKASPNKAGLQDNNVQSKAVR